MQEAAATEWFNERRSGMAEGGRYEGGFSVYEKEGGITCGGRLSVGGGLSV